MSAGGVGGQSWKGKGIHTGSRQVSAGTFSLTETRKLCPKRYAFPTPQPHILCLLPTCRFWVPFLSPLPQFLAHSSASFLTPHQR